MSPFEVAKQTSRANSTHRAPRRTEVRVADGGECDRHPPGARSTKFAYAASGSNDGRKSPTGSSTKLRVPGIGWVVFCRSGPCVGFAGTRRSGDERRQPDRDDGARVQGFTTSGYRRTSELCQVGDAAAGLAAREPSV